VDRVIVVPGVDLESMPDLPPGALPWLVAALLLAWLALRVALLRGQVARARAVGEAPPPGPRWLAPIAAQRLAIPVLLGLLGLCAVVLVRLLSP
jgi:hypothetical protein